MDIKNTKIRVGIDLRILCVILALLVVAMLVIWMPWRSAEKSDEIIKVTGETVLKSEPDQYVFYPAYEYRHADKSTAQTQATDKAKEIVAKLNDLGLPESQIKSSVNGYMNHPVRDTTSEEYVYTAQVTITVSSKDSAQKVQDYIATTGAQGSVTPQGSFSESKRKELESQARNEATKDARHKADQSAESLGFKLGRVKSVEDGAGFAGPIPLDARSGSIEMGDKAISNSLPVLPGENELHYSVTVTYFVR